MLMDYETYATDEESSNSSNTQSARNTAGEQVKAKDGDLGDFLDPDLTLACQTKKPDPLGVKSRPATSKKYDDTRKTENDCLQCKTSNEQYFHINMNAMLKLKESTKKLLCVLEEIQSKTHAKCLNLDHTSLNLSKFLKPLPPSKDFTSTTDVINTCALKKLEAHTKTLDSIYIQEEEDDCSVYQRLTRKCNCLNQHEYNDFIIHFNEDTKYRTSVAGEIIKNMRILKKFLYMNGDYTKNALLFLNEGLADSSLTEKVEIIQGCAHADICNVFDDNSIVLMYIAWPCKNEYCGDTVTQALTASLLFKLAQLEEGRRYLNYSSKITNDIKKVLKKKTSFLEFDTVDSLNATLNLLNPPLTQNVNVTYYCKPLDEGIGKKTVYALVDYRQYMTLDEVFAHLDLLHILSNRENRKFELTTHLPILLLLFKRMLVEYDNSEINIIVTNILTNVVAKNITKEKEPDLPKTMIIADIATEPIEMKNETLQYPPRKPNAKKVNKSKQGLGTAAPSKFRNTSKRKVSDRHATSTSNCKPSETLNRSIKFNKDNTRCSIIVVPVENEKQS